MFPALPRVFCLVSCRQCAMPPCRQDETKIAPALERVASNVGMEVAVGSYPVDR